MGFFEDLAVQTINEDLLAPLFQPRMLNPLQRWRHQRATLPRNLRWVSQLPVEATVKSTPEVDARIREQVSIGPFWLKDPRFSYTLPAWRPSVPGAGFICIFREPQRTANSIVIEWERHPKRRVRMTYEAALGNWSAMYGRILSYDRPPEDWLFVHYDQLLDGTAIPRLEAFTEAEVDPSFAESRLRRSPSSGDIGSRERALYDELCSLAQL